MGLQALFLVFIGIGAVIMAVAIFQGLRLQGLVGRTGVKNLWRTQIALMSIFLVGYALAFWLTLQSNLEMIMQLTAVIFALGAFFVFLTVRISVHMATALNSFNVDLEQKIAERTLALTVAHATIAENMKGLKNTQQQLLQAAKMASLGTMAAGVAHELNNPLAIIYGYTELIASDEKTSDLHSDKFGKIFLAIKRMRKIIDHLGVFSRDTANDDQQDVDVAEVFASALVFAGKEVEGAGIEIKSNFCHRGTLIYADPVQIESVFQNLFFNSRDAFLGIRDQRQKKITVESRLVDERLEIVYQDNACGASDDIVEHMFDPFFTTKPVGQGVGLGLSIVHEIIAQHRGKITARVEEGGGLCFVIDMPISVRREEQRPAPVIEKTFSRQGASALGKRLSVLVIDDEIEMCNLIHAFLADEFQVNATSDPSLALSLIDNHKFDMILTDLRMPGVSGLDIIKRAHEVQPRTPVVAITGFSASSQIVKNAIAGGAAAILNKPFKGKDDFKSFLRKSVEVETVL